MKRDIARPSKRSLPWRAAAAACRREDQRWIEAMLAESAAIEDAAERRRWMIGAGRVMIAALRDRAAAVMPPRRRLLTLAVTLGAVISGAGFVIDYQGWAVDDDLLGALAVAFGALALTLMAMVQRSSLPADRGGSL